VKTNQNFFSSVDATATWLADHPGAFTVSVPDTYHMVRRAYERFVTQGSCG